MLFILQDRNESDAMAVEIEELRYELENSGHNYIIAKSKFFTKMNKDINLKDAIPVGTIEFVSAYLRAVHAVYNMRPIEIPKALRLPQFLLRDYQIVKPEDIPKNTVKFIKNASVLKQPTMICNTNDIPEDYLKRDINISIGDSTINEPGHFYQISDTLNIMAEYRVIVLNNKIMGIQFYDGKCTVMPNEKDINKIQEMVLRYSQVNDCPEAYGMDVAIVKTKNTRDLALIEIGPFVAMGSYGCRGSFLPQLYQRGIQWYLKHNTEIQP